MDAFIKRASNKKSEPEVNRYPVASSATEGPPAKKLKLEAHTEDTEQSDSSAVGDLPRWRGDEGDDVGDRRNTHRPTDVENALPPADDEEAIHEYEAFKLSQSSAPGDAHNEDTKPKWVRGQSSIYVDAFNLALETVLDEESGLFDARELNVFQQWKNLSYEAQFL